MKKIFSIYFTLIGIRSCIALFYFFYMLNFEESFSVSLAAFIVQLFLGVVGTVNNLYIGYTFDTLFDRSAKFLRVFPMVFFAVLILVEWTWGGGVWLPALITLHGIVLVALFSSMEKEKIRRESYVSELSVATSV